MRLCRSWKLALLGLLATSCNKLPFEEVEQDWNDRQATAVRSQHGDLQFAVAAMITPQETARDYRDLVQGFGRELGLRVDVVYRKSYEQVNRLLLEGKLDIAFVCTGGYLALLQAAPATRILAVPVVDGKSTYRSLIIVRDGFRASRFADLRGARFAYTEPLSFSGYLYPVSLVRAMGANEETFFSAHVFAESHDRSIHSVRRGVYDAAAVDSLVFDYVRRDRPERVRGLRVLLASPEVGIPPVVAAPNTPDQKIARWRSALLRLHRRPETHDALDRLGIERFVEPPPDLYRTASDLWRKLGR